MKKALPAYDPDRMAHALAAALAPLGVALRPRDVERLDAYARLLREGSTRMNLTAILDDAGIAVRHFADSLSALPLLLDACRRQPDRGGPFRVLDVGSGAGLPGIPLHIALEAEARTAGARVHWVLMDALAKRVGFLREVIDALDLHDIEAVHARAEDAAHTPLRESFDWVTARAVASLNVLAEYGLPFVRIGGLFVAMKGPDPADETDAAKRAIDLLGGRAEPARTLFLPDEKGGRAQRTLLPIRKIKPCPPRWPRAAGKPEKAPIS